VVAANEPLELRVGTKVHDKTNLELARTQVIEQLGFVRGIDGARSLDLDNDGGLDDQIGLERANCNTAEVNGKWNLAFDAQANAAEHDGRGFFIDRFKKTVPKSVIDREEPANKPLRQIGMKKVKTVNLPSLGR
jgi:hypothetical protein